MIYHDLPKLLVNTIVMLCFDICSEEWLSVSKISINRLDCLYNMATKFVSIERRETLQDCLVRNIAILILNVKMTLHRRISKKNLNEHHLSIRNTQNHAEVI